MPADSLTMRRANPHVCCPLIFIELFLEQLLYDRRDVTSRRIDCYSVVPARDLLCLPPSELFGGTLRQTPLPRLLLPVTAASRAKQLYSKKLTSLTRMGELVIPLTHLAAKGVSQSSPG